MTYRHLQQVRELRRGARGEGTQPLGRRAPLVPHERDPRRRGRCCQSRPGRNRRRERLHGRRAGLAEHGGGGGRHVHVDRDRGDDHGVGRHDRPVPVRRRLQQHARFGRADLLVGLWVGADAERRRNVHDQAEQLGDDGHMANDRVTVTEGVLRVCCADEANLIQEPQSSDLLVKTCRVCGRHHYELGVDPAAFGVELKGV